MTPLHASAGGAARLACAVVVGVEQDGCEVVAQGRRVVAAYLASFPSPRTERVSPGHLVALATVADGAPVVVRRWFDAVVVGEDADHVRLWEPARGDVVATRRSPGRTFGPGTRAYASAPAWTRIKILIRVWTRPRPAACAFAGSGVPTGIRIFRGPSACDAACSGGPGRSRPA